MPPQAEEMALKILGKGLLQELPIEVSSFVLRCALPQHVLKEKLEEEARRSADGKCNGQFEFISPLAVVNPPIDRAIAAKGQHQSDESAGQKRSAARDVNRAADEATDAYDNAKNVGRDVDAENAPGNQSGQQRGTYGDVGAKLVETALFHAPAIPSAFCFPDARERGRLCRSAGRRLRNRRRRRSRWRNGYCNWRRCAQARASGGRSDGLCAQNLSQHGVGGGSAVGAAGRTSHGSGNSAVDRLDVESVTL